MPVGASVLIPALIGGAATAGGALLSAGAADRASQVQAQAAKDAQATQLKMYEQSREDVKPYNTIGQGAATSLAELYGLPTPANPDGGTMMSEGALAKFQASPDYAFTQSEGLRGLDSSAAARGTLLSGGHSKDVLGYASGLASQQFNNYANRLSGLSSLGANAASGNASRAIQTGAGVAGSQLAGGEAQASGIVGSSKNITSGLAGLGTTFSDLAARSAYAAPSAPQISPFY